MTTTNSTISINFKSIFSWTLKNIVLCLLPFFVGALLRYVYIQKLSIQIFDAGELAMSISILYIFIMKSANSSSLNNDKELKDNLTIVCVFGFVSFLLLFGIHSFIKIHLENVGQKTFQLYKDTIFNSASKENLISSVEKIKNNESSISELKFLSVQSFIGSIINICSIIAIPLAVIFKFKYKLED